VLTSLLLLPLVAAPPNDPPKKGEVTVSFVAVDSPQPAGCPVVLDVKLTNVGKEKVSWWCGGPAAYPGAEHFAVQVRYDDTDEWLDIEPTNGQYTQGSGRNTSLDPGASITVPLALPVTKERIEYVMVRITPREWNAAKPAETGVHVFKNSKRELDRYRARLIAAAIDPRDAFSVHLAQRYADAVVIDTLTKMIDTDNDAIFHGIATVLAAQQELPAAAGETLAKAVRRSASHYSIRAALLTRSEPARKAVLDLLSAPDLHTRAVASDGLRLSPGDTAWLRRARAALVEAEKGSQKDANVAKSIARDIRWLDSRIPAAER
jgi:hypothetical protein